MTQTEDVEALSKEKAIKSMSVPKNVSTGQEFLRLTNYYGVYVPNMHNLKTPLNSLKKKKTSKGKIVSEMLESF